MRKLTTTIEGKIFYLLQSDPIYRDNDLKLCARVWDDECIEMGKPLPEITGVQFLVLYVQDKLTNSESITRLRRKIQMNNPSLRGSTWKDRQTTESHKAQAELGYKV